MSRRTHSIVWSALGSLALLACSSDPPPAGAAAAGCSLNSDCSNPLVCAFAKCHNQCKETRDCGAGQRCVHSESGSGICQLTVEATCASSASCEGKSLCASDHMCRDKCDSDMDCLVGQKCPVEKVCAETTEVDSTNHLVGAVADASTDTSVVGAGGSGGSGGAGGSGGSAGSGGSGGSGGGVSDAGDSGDVVVPCEAGLATCNGGAICGTNVTLTTQCGGCGIVCDTSHNTAKCENLLCVPTCNAGYLDCDGKGETGCETAIATNDMNCGACKHVCALTTCMDSMCKPVALNTNGDSYRTAFGGGFLFIDRVNAQPPTAYDIRRIAADGSGEVDFAADAKAPGAMVVVGTDLYYSFLPLSVFKKPLTAALADAPTPVFTPVELPYYMTVNGNALYWISNTGVIYTRALTAAASDPGGVIVTSGVAGISSFFVTNDAFYWLTTDGNLRTAPIGGGTASLVPSAATGQGSAVTADSTYVYFTANLGGGTEGIYRYKTGGAIEPLVFKGGITPGFMLVDDTSLYFASYPYANHEIDKAPKGVASNGTKLATQYGIGPLVAYDATFLFTAGDGTQSAVYRFVK